MNPLDLLTDFASEVLSLVGGHLALFVAVQVVLGTGAVVLGRRSAAAADGPGDPDEFQVPDDDTCASCGCRWKVHQGGANGVTCGAHGCPAYNYVPEGWR